MKILLDEGLRLRAAALLREKGLDAVHLTEIADPSTDDRWLLEEARRPRASCDSRCGFSRVARIEWLVLTVGRTHPTTGIVGGGCRRACGSLVSDHAAALTAGAALSVRAHLVEIRRLPLTT